jgi:hypothetical protein
MALQPKRASRGGGIDTGLVPPRHFVTAAMHLAMTPPAQRHGEFVAHDRVPEIAQISDDAHRRGAGRSGHPSRRQNSAALSMGGVWGWKSGSRRENGTIRSEGTGADRAFLNGTATAQPAIDVKSLHAKIGELTLENDFLEGALTKAGLLSAKRWSTVSTICPSPSRRLLILTKQSIAVSMDGKGAWRN